MLAFGPARWALFAIVATALAYAIPVAGLGFNQGAHYALTQAMYRGQARIDDYRWETGDLAYFHGHFYSTKAPGLSAAALPAYAALDVTGVRSVIETHTATAWKAARIMIWALGLWAVVLPAVILLLLVRAAAERVETGFGTLAAITLGVGTIMLPFATVFFSHVLSACLGFAAFVLVRQQSSWAAWAAGVIGGLAITVEYTLAIVAVVLAVRIATGGAATVRRTLAYLGGVVLGATPLLVYDKLAFGSFTHLSYVDAVSRRGSSGHAAFGANTRGPYGVSLPHPGVALDLLLSSRGLITLTPVLAMSTVGLVLLYRRGRRADALTMAAIFVGFLAFNAGYQPAFGGATVGPRFLLPALPFLALALPPAYRRYPLCTSGLAAVSVTTAVIATIGKPLPDGHVGRWVARLFAGDVQDTIAIFFGSRARATVLVILVLVAVSIAAAIRATPSLTIGLREVSVASLALLAWVATTTLALFVAHSTDAHSFALLGLAAGLGAAVIAVVARRARAPEAV